MNFLGALAPLYLAGLAAISLPLIFHLIRRTPSGEQNFSSLMFLQPSPPRLTKRSRLDNLLLLLIRACVIAFLVFAFMRPLWRQQGSIDFQGLQNRRVAILIDTSASMQRSTAWEQASQEFETILKKLQDGDQVAIFSYDETLQTQMDFDGSLKDKQTLRGNCQAAFRDLEPGWKASQLPASLKRIADRLVATSIQSDSDPLLQLHVISDMQSTQGLSELQGYEWPESVRLSLHSIRPEKDTNAGIRLVEASSSSSASVSNATSPGNSKRIRIANSSTSTTDQFSVKWLDNENRELAKESLYVPIGETRSFPSSLDLDAQTEATKIRLSGDNADFDNEFHIAQLQQMVMRVVYVGKQQMANPEAKSLDFFLKQALVDNRQRRFDFEHWEATELGGRLMSPKAPTTSQVDWLVIAQPLPESDRDLVKEFCRTGGRVLVVATSEFIETDDLSSYLGESIQVKAGAVTGFQLLGQINFQSSIFQSFADPRFSDFTSIHFWNYRQLDFESAPSDQDGSMRTLARFENGVPFLISSKQDQGSLCVLTSGWTMDDSQMALSTKFVPLISALANDRARLKNISTHRIGEPLDCGSVADRDSKAKRSMTLPNGATVRLDTDTQYFTDTQLPGIYEYQHGQTRIDFAVNVDPRESELEPVESDAFKDLGIPVGEQPSRQELIDMQRKYQDVELERKQKLWAWLIIIALVFVILEMFVAGRIQLRRPAPS